MFGALNRFISVLDRGSDEGQNGRGNSDGSYGFQILRNNNEELPLEPWFDFIIGINGRTLVRYGARMSCVDNLNNELLVLIQLLRQPMLTFLTSHHSLTLHRITETHTSSQQKSATAPATPYLLASGAPKVPASARYTSMCRAKLAP
jgi:hypothetical protein